jgi:hypothetical protein
MASVSLTEAGETQVQAFLRFAKLKVRGAGREGRGQRPMGPLILWVRMRCKLTAHSRTARGRPPSPTERPACA